MNNLKVTGMMVGLMVLFMSLGYFFGGQNGLVLAFVLAAAMNIGAYWFSDRVVLRMYRAREIRAEDHRRLFRTVEKVIQKVSMPMMPMPRVYIVPTRAPNAYATGRNAEHAAVAVTEGLLELLTDDELEGVIGHEISHIRHKDMLIGMVAATFAGAIGIIASIARWGALFGGYSRDGNRGGGIGLLVTALVAPLVAIVLQTAISRQREYKADAEAGRTTGQYLPLASALQKLHRSPARMNLEKNPSTAHLMIANPLSGRGLSAMFSTHPPVEKRIKRLKEMAQQAPYQYNV